MENKVAKAIHETNGMIMGVKGETRKRKNWGYIHINALKEWSLTQTFPNNVIPSNEELVRLFFGTKLDAPVRLDSKGELYAVWRKLTDLEPGLEPEFISEADAAVVIDAAAMLATEAPAKAALKE